MLPFLREKVRDKMEREKKNKKRLNFYPSKLEVNIFHIRLQLTSLNDL
jgi:hypothetical protein